MASRGLRWARHVARLGGISLYGTEIIWVATLLTLQEEFQVIANKRTSCVIRHRVPHTATRVKAFSTQWHCQTTSPRLLNGSLTCCSRCITNRKLTGLWLLQVTGLPKLWLVTHCPHVTLSPFISLSSFLHFLFSSHSLFFLVFLSVFYRSFLSLSL